MKPIRFECGAVVISSEKENNTRRCEHGEAARNTVERGPRKVPGAREAGPEARGRRVATFRGNIMAIDSELCFSGPFVGNGSRKDYDFLFYIDSPGHLLVEKNDVALTYGTDYTVELLGKGGTVTLAVPLEYGSRLTIRRNMALLQLVRLLNNSPLYPSVLEKAFDYAMMIDQQLLAELARCVKMPASITNDDSQVTADQLIAKLSELVNAASASAASAKNAASEAAASSVGALDFVCPAPENSTDILHLVCDFSLDGKFVDDDGMPLESVISIRTDTAAGGFYLPDENGELSHDLAAAGVTTDDVGKTMLLKISEVPGLLTGTIYFWRSYWSNLSENANYRYGLLVIPAEHSDDGGGGTGGGDDGGGGGTTTPTASEVTLAMIPGTVTGLQLSTASETDKGSEVRKIYVNAGRCMDITGKKLISSSVTLQKEVGKNLKRNSLYHVLLMRKKSDSQPDVDLHLYFDQDSLTYSAASGKWKPWSSPAMFADDFPAGYLAEASTTLADAAKRTTNPYRAFDRVGAAATNHWRSMAGGLPQHVQMIFDTPKAINLLEIKGHSAAPYAKTIKFYTRDKDGNWNDLKDGATTVAPLALQNVASASGSVALAAPLLCYGVRAEVTANHTAVLYAIINEFSVSGFAYADSPAGEEVTGLPDGYSIYREIGTFKTDANGGLLLGSAVSYSQQEIKPMHGRVWVSPPFMPTPNTLVEFTHSLDLDPLYARTDVVLQCVEPDFEYAKGEFAAMLQSNTSDLSLPMIQRDKVGFWIPGGFRAGKRNTYGFTTALNKEKWMAFIRIFY